MSDKQIINAFHKDYVKTYEPDLMQHFRLASAGKKTSMTLSAQVEEIRKTNPSYGYVGMGEVPRDIKAPKMMRPNLKPKEFHVYSKARREG